MTTDHRTPAQVAQDAEGDIRRQTEGDRFEGDFTQQIDDATGERNDPPRREQPRFEADDIDTDGRRGPPDHRPPSDIARADIAARFKRARIEKEGEVPFNGDVNDPEMQYGKVGRQQLEPEPGADDLIGGEPEPAPQRRQQQQPQAGELDENRMVTRTVRGLPVTKRLGDWLADASKVTAADSYLDEGRTLLEDARNLKRTSAQHTGQDDQHPDRRTGAQDDGLDLRGSEGDHHPDPLEAAIEEIQFGDPKNAAGKIRSVIEQASDQSADKRQKERLVKNDLAKSQQQLQKFMGENPDLRDDEVANVVLEKTMYDIYREDMLKLGLNADVIPTNNNELANWHRFYRVEGYQVRDTAAALAEAKSRFNKWRGVSSGEGRQQRQEPRRETQVQVNVDRTARRQNIPSQPTRAAAPRPDAVREAPARPSRTDIVMNMRRQRGQPV